jgi:hypothetical protein
LGILFSSNICICPNQGNLFNLFFSNIVDFLTLPYISLLVNHLTPNGHFRGRTAPLTYRLCIFYLFNKYTY